MVGSLDWSNFAALLPRSIPGGTSRTWSLILIQYNDRHNVAQNAVLTMWTR